MLQDGQAVGTVKETELYVFWNNESVNRAYIKDLASKLELAAPGLLASRAQLHGWHKPDVPLLHVIMGPPAGGAQGAGASSTAGKGPSAARPSSAARPASAGAAAAESPPQAGTAATSWPAAAAGGKCQLARHLLRA